MVYFPWKPNEIHKTLLVKNNGIAAFTSTNKSLTNTRNIGSSYVRGTIVEIGASVYDESPIGLAGEHCDDSTRWTTMSSDINTAQRRGGATSYK